jgi:hypothetical protein
MIKSLNETIVNILFESDKTNKIQHHKTLFKHHYKQAMTHKQVGDTHHENKNTQKALLSYHKMNIHLKAFVKHMKAHDDLKDH